jgi:hypothetical protein
MISAPPWFQISPDEPRARDFQGPQLVMSTSGVTPGGTPHFPTRTRWTAQRGRRARMRKLTATHATSMPPAT